MSDPIAATCRSGCALCEQITLRLGGAAGATPFKLLLETPSGLRSQYVITGWPDKTETKMVSGQLSARWSTSRGHHQPRGATSGAGCTSSVAVTNAFPSAANMTPPTASPQLLALLDAKRAQLAYEERPAVQSFLAGEVAKLESLMYKSP